MSGGTVPPGGGGSHIDMVYEGLYMPAFWGAFSRNLVYSDGGGG